MEFVIGGIIYFILLVTLGIMSIRKGHWVMFIIGIFFPLFWLIGALLPPRARGGGVTGFASHPAVFEIESLLARTAPVRATGRAGTGRRARSIPPPNRRGRHR